MRNKYEKSMTETINHVKKFNESKPITEQDIINITNEISRRWNARNVLNYNTKENK